jgi:hypothetical protein
MASKYLQKFPVPDNFPEILQDFTREILREQPIDIIEFGARYFKAKENGEEFIWDPTKSNQPKPADYPRVQGAVDPAPPGTSSSRERTASKPEPPAGPGGSAPA